MGERRPIVGDSEVLSVLVALAPLDARLDRYRNRLLNAREFDVEECLDNGWSSGERVLIQLAGALWKGRGAVDLGYIAGELGGPFFQAAMDAIAVYGKRDITTFGADAVDRALEQA